MREVPKITVRLTETRASVCYNMEAAFLSLDAQNGGLYRISGLGGGGEVLD